MRKRQFAFSLRTTRQQGRCVGCGGLYALKLDGTIYAHRFIAEWCVGSRQEPFMKRPAYTVYHWDTFDGETFKVGFADSLDAAKKIVTEKYQDRIRDTGADRVDIVDAHGNVVQSYSVG